MVSNPVLIGDFLHRIKRPIKIESTSRYKLVTVKLKHKGVVLREEKFGAEIKSNMYQVKAGDFILSGIDARNGAFGIVPPELDGAVVTNDFWYFEIDDAVVDKDFFLELTATHWFDEICRKGSDGTTQRIRLQKNKFFNQVIHLPDLKEQWLFNRRFQAVKVSNQALTSELAHQKNLLKELRQQILQEAIEGKLTTDWRAQNPDVEPARELLKRIAAEKEQLAKDKKIKAQKPLPPIADEEKPFELPQGWVWCRLGRITNIVRGGSPRPAGDSRFYNGDIPFLKVADLTSDSAMRLNNYTYTIKQAGLHKTRKVPAETLMLTNSGATLGIPKICMFDTTFNDGIAAFIFIHSELFKPFFYYVLLSKTSWFLKETSRGQGQPNLNIDIIGNTVIYLPSFYEQQAIVIKVEKLLAFCDQLEAQITQNQVHAEQLMQAVLKEAFGHNSKVEPVSITSQASTYLPDVVVCGD